MIKPEKWQIGGGFGLLIFAAFYLLAAPAAAQQPESAIEGPDWSTMLRLGMEYDDNPLRSDEYDGGGDAVMRYLVGADLSQALGEGSQVSATLRHGGKFFRNQREANALVTQVGGSANWWAHHRLSLRGMVDLKDRTEWGRDRDYTRGGAALRLASRAGPVRFWADGGWRYFTFKPTPSSSYRGPMTQLGARWMIRGDLALDANWTHLWRNYDGIAWRVRDDRFIPRGEGVHRRDSFHQWGVSLRYQDRINARLGYNYAYNRSNSYGQGLRRHSLAARVTVPLPWDLFLSARGELQRARYEDAFQIDETFRLDEDHRNALVAAISRPIAGPWEVELRYGIFAHEFGADRDYRRQIIALSIGAYLERDD